MELLGVLVNPRFQVQGSRLAERQLAQPPAVAPSPIAPPVRRKVHLSASDIDKIVAAYQAGGSQVAIAAEFGIHRHTICALLEKEGVVRRATKSLMSDDDVVRATQRYEAGDSLATIALDLDVSPNTVGRALKQSGVLMRPRRGR